MKIDVLGVPMNPGTRRYRVTVERLDLTYTGRVLWVDEATATEPLQIVMEGRDRDTRVLTQTDDGWLLSTGRGGDHDRVVSVESVKQTHRARLTPLEKLLVIAR